MLNTSQKPLIHGITLVAGGAIGAGMFALPVVSVGAGFTWSVLGLVLVWFFTYRACLALLNATLSFPIGASFNTVVKNVLNPRWAALNNLAIVFVMTILMYAYTTAGASIIEFTINQISPNLFVPERGVLSLLFSTFIALLVFSGSLIVSRSSMFLLALMTLSFVLVCAHLLPLSSSALLFDGEHRVSFLPVALPVFVATLACAGLVPSLVKHYKADHTAIKRCLLLGSLLSLAIYIVWLIVTLGVINQTDFSSLIEAGGNSGDLLTGLVDSGANNFVRSLLTIFSHLAIVTSFLSIGLGFLDFVLDRFGLDGSVPDRAFATLVVFAPPAMFSFFLPYGFVTAIAYAGLAVLFSFFVIPALLQHRLSRDRTPSLITMAIIVFAITLMLVKVLTSLDYLPSFS